MGSTIALQHVERYDQYTRDEFNNIVTALQGIFSTLGVWVPISDPTLFSGNGLMTWTVEARDQTALAYTMIGNTMMINLTIDTSSVGGTVNNTLQMKLPNGKTVRRAMRAPCQIFDNSAATSVLGYIRTTAGSQFLSISRFDVANFTASTNLTFISGQVFVEVI